MADTPSIPRQSFPRPVPPPPIPSRHSQRPRVSPPTPRPINAPTSTAPSLKVPPVPSPAGKPLAPPIIQKNSRVAAALPAPTIPPSLPAPSTKLLISRSTPPVAEHPATKQGAETVVIRTMQDDLQGQPGTPSATTSAPKGAPVAGSSAPTFPLPPRHSDGRPSKTIHKPRRQRQRLIPVLIIVLGLVIVGSGGIAGWLWLMSSSNDTTDGTTGTITGATTILPANAASIIQYQLLSATDRSNVLSAWQSSDPASVTSLLRGDPRLLANEPSITEFYYVLLPQDTRPYLIVPVTPATTTLLANNGDATILKQDSWYIAHSLSTGAYSDALAEGSVAVDGDASIFTATTPDTPLRAHIGPALLTKLRQEIMGPAFVIGELQSMNVTGTLQTTTKTVTIAGQGTLVSPVDTSGRTIDQKLLSYIPATSRGIVMGINFAADSSAFATTSAAIDTNVLQDPAVSALVSQLTTPYAFFVDQQNPTNTSYGLIIQLPPALQSTMPLGDQRLENGLRALVPLLTGQRSLAPLSFNGGVYRDIQLRFVNLAGSAQAIDYARAESYLLLATSKDTMFALIDAAAGQVTPLPNTPTWSNIFTVWGALPQTQRLLAGSTTIPELMNLLPATNGIRFGLALDPTSAAQTASVQGVIQLHP